MGKNSRTITPITIITGHRMNITLSGLLREESRIWNSDTLLEKNWLQNPPGRNGNQDPNSKRSGKNKPENKHKLSPILSASGKMWANTDKWVLFGKIIVTNFIFHRHSPDCSINACLCF